MKILFILLLAGILNAQSLHKPISYISISTISTLTYQKAFDLEWQRAAGFGYITGMTVGAIEIMRYNQGTTELARVLGYSVAGAFLSYPFREVEIIVVDYGIGLRWSF